MPVRRVAQPLWFLVSAPGSGGAAVAMDAWSRRAARVGQGRARPCGGCGWGAWRIGLGPAGVQRALGGAWDRPCRLGRCCIPQGLRCLT